MGWFSGPSFNTSKSSSCFYDYLYGKCGGCKQMNPHAGTSGFFSGYKFPCSRTGGSYRWDDISCSKVDYVDPNSVDCVERYRLFTGKRYYILTAICEILGIDFETVLFQKIRTLIDLVREDKTTTKEAIGYDTFGIEVANQLREDAEKEEICNFLLKNYLINVYSLIKLNKTKEAIELYKEMVKYLFIRYREQNYLIEPSIFENKKILVK